MVQVPVVDVTQSVRKRQQANARAAWCHIDGPALEELIGQIGTERVLPVHTQELEWFRARWAGRLVTAGYGRPVGIG